MDRRGFLQAMAALFGAAAMPAGILNAADIPDTIKLTAPNKQIILEWLRIGDTVIDLDCSLIFPPGCAPEIKFEGDKALLCAGGKTWLAIALTARTHPADTTFDMVWWELGDDYATDRTLTRVVHEH
jgi:hypothetical protein